MANGFDGVIDCYVAEYKSGERERGENSWTDKLALTD